MIKFIITEYLLFLFGVVGTGIKKIYNMLCACCILSRFSCVWLFVTLWTIALQTHCPWNSPGKNTGVGCHFLLQGIFLNQGLNPWLLCLLHCRWILYQWATGEAPYSTDSITVYLQLEEGVQHTVIWSVCHGRTASETVLKALQEH